MSSTIFNLGAVKLLKKILRFQESDIQIITGNSADPTVTAVDAVAGSIYIRGGTNEVYVKNTSGSNTDFSKLGTVDSLNAHVNDTTDAHDASAISNVPAGNLAATDVQAALNELQSELDGKALASDLSNHLSDATDAHDASAISSVASGNLVATDVQSALNELQSDIDTRALDSAVIKKDGSVAFTAAQSMGGFKITSLAAGTASSDAVNKGQMDAALEGLKPKAAVRVATTADIVIATALNAGDVLDGITLANGDRVLVKDQTAAEANGIYVVSATPARATDFDQLSPIDEINGSLVAVQEGTANAGKVFVQSGAVAVLDTDPINFVFFNSSASLVGGDGITVSGSNISVDHDGQGLQFNANQLALELDGTTLSKSAAGLKVNAVANAEITAGVDAAKIADGSVSNAEFQYLDGVTGSIQTQINDRALDSVVLKKDGSVTATGTLNMGSNAITAISSLTATVVNSQRLVLSASGQINGVATTLPGGDSSAINLQNTVTNSRMSIHSTNNPTSDALSTSHINIETGNKTAGTGNSGDIILRTGTSFGGTRGSVSITATDINVNSTKITNLADPTLAQDAATKNYVDNAIPAAYTNEQAQDAVGGILTDSATVDFTYDDTANTITAIVIDASITNAKVATGIDAVKLADGSVTNTELQYINSVTSNVQTQLDNKEPLHNTTLVQATNASLGSNVTNEVVTALSFAHASINGCSIDYRIAKGTLVRTGKMILATDGTTVAFNDMFVETVDSTIVFEAVINGANINIRHSNTETGSITFTYQQNRFAV